MKPPADPPVPGPFQPPPALGSDRPPSGARMRTIPRQQRARAAVQAILRATGELLDDAGFDALTTTAVAERAQVNIATLYRYFPDKYALIEALALAIETERVDKLAPMLRNFGLAPDWRTELQAIVEKLLDLRLRRTGMKGLRRALHSAPPLWITEQQGFGRMAERLAEALAVRVATLTPAQAERIAVTLLAMVIGLLDQAMRDPAQRRAVMAEGVLALERYLAPYLD